MAALCAVVWPNLAYTQSSGTTSDDAVQSVRLETIVVTASRREQSLGDIAASMEVIDATAFETTSGAYLTDIIKKNASVDVIEYPGGLSGVGLRGFRPQFSGVNQRVLVLVDGRPSGATSLANISRAGVERVEILKGSASAAYGPSVMGGVVNIITRKSDGDMEGNVSTRFGSFDTLEFAGSVGGALNDRFNFDWVCCSGSRATTTGLARVAGRSAISCRGMVPNATTHATPSALSSLGAPLSWRPIGRRNCVSSATTGWICRRRAPNPAG